METSNHVSLDWSRNSNISGNDIDRQYWRDELRIKSKPQRGFQMIIIFFFQALRCDESYRIKINRRRRGNVCFRPDRNDSFHTSNASNNYGQSLRYLMQAFALGPDCIEIARVPLGTRKQLKTKLEQGFGGCHQLFNTRATGRWVVEINPAVLNSCWKKAGLWGHHSEHW